MKPIKICTEPGCTDERRINPTTGTYQDGVCSEHARTRWKAQRDTKRAIDPMYGRSAAEKARHLERQAIKAGVEAGIPATAMTKLADKVAEYHNKNRDGHSIGATQRRLYAEREAEAALLAKINAARQEACDVADAPPIVLEKRDPWAEHQQKIIDHHVAAAKKFSQRNTKPLLHAQLERIRRERKETYEAADKKDAAKLDGFVYVVVNPNKLDRCKIGHSRDPYSRLSEAQCWDDERSFKLADYVFFADSKAAEATMHKGLSGFRVRGQDGKLGEWFLIEPAIAVKLVKDLASQG